MEMAEIISLLDVGTYSEKRPGDLIETYNRA
jgi:hypothetical protein